jgi:hypothetical protein
MSINHESKIYERPYRYKNSYETYSPFLKEKNNLDEEAKHMDICTMIAVMQNCT